MSRATKIVATLGPASSTPEVLERMLRAGVDVVRLNFSHGKAQDHIDRAQMVRDVLRKLGVRQECPGGLFARLEQVGRAAQFDSNNHDEQRRAFRVVNAAVGFARGGWTVSVWARNLLDFRYEKRVFFFGNAEPDYAETRYESRADPRQVGVTAALRF